MTRLRVPGLALLVVVAPIAGCGLFGGDDADALEGAWRLQRTNGESVPNSVVLVWAFRDGMIVAFGETGCLTRTAYTTDGDRITASVLSNQGDTCGDEIGDTFSFRYTLEGDRLTTTIQDPDLGTGVFDFERVRGEGLAGVWIGEYAWSCDDPGDGSRSGASELVLLVERPSDDPARSTGLAVYLGGAAPLSTTRYRNARIGDMGTIEPGTGTPAADGGTVRIRVSSSGAFVNNEFTGTLSRGQLSGTTLNGDARGNGWRGCSASHGPAGTFSVERY